MRRRRLRQRRAEGLTCTPNQKPEGDMKRAVLLASSLLLAACTAIPSPTTVRPVVTGPQIIPAPASLTITAGAPFELTRATSIVVDGTNPEVMAIGQALGTLSA